MGMNRQNHVSLDRERFLTTNDQAKQFMQDRCDLELFKNRIANQLVLRQLHGQTVTHTGEIYAFYEKVA